MNFIKYIRIIQDKVVLYFSFIHTTIDEDLTQYLLVIDLTPDLSIHCIKHGKLNHHIYDTNQTLRYVTTYNTNTSETHRPFPACAHVLYGYPNCNHLFDGNRCIHCYWDESMSSYIISKIDKNQVHEKN